MRHTLVLLAAVLVRMIVQMLLRAFSYITTGTDTESIRVIAWEKSISMLYPVAPSRSMNRQNLNWNSRVTSLAFKCFCRIIDKCIPPCSLLFERASQRPGRVHGAITSFSNRKTAFFLRFKLQLLGQVCSKIAPKVILRFLWTNNGLTVSKSLCLIWKHAMVW